MEKRGEITSQQIILIVLALAGFAIILYFLVVLNIQGRGEEQACKLALLARGTATTDIPFLKESFPLACKTSKTCIVGEDGECKQFFGKEKYKNVEVNEKDAKENIEKAIANEYIKCWDTVGKGNLQVFGTLSEDQLGLDTAKPRCMVCARIAVDGVSDDILRSVNVDEYMEKTKISGSETTYLESLKQGSKEIVSSTLEEDKITYRLGANRPKEVAIVFMQISAPATGKAGTTPFLGILGTVVGGGMVGKSIPGSSTISNLKFIKPVLKVAKLGVVVTLVAAPLAAELQSWGSRSLVNSYCGTFEGGNSQGCSVLEVVPYEAGSLNQLCSVVEGIA